MFCPCELDLGPRTMTYGLDIDILPLDIHICAFVCSSVRITLSKVLAHHLRRV